MNNMSNQDKDNNTVRKEFVERCHTIAKILSEVDPSYKFLTEFEISNDKVIGFGEEVDWTGYIQEHYEEFPARWLTMPDEEIETMVSQIKEQSND